MHILNIKKKSKMLFIFEPDNAGGALSGIQHSHLTLMLPSGPPLAGAVLGLREGIPFGHAYTSQDEETQAQVEAAVVAVGEEGGQQRVQQPVAAEAAAGQQRVQQQVAAEAAAGQQRVQQQVALLPLAGAAAGQQRVQVVLHGTIPGHLDGQCPAQLRRQAR
jgi:hypothetical protein